MKRIVILFSSSVALLIFSCGENVNHSEYIDSDSVLLQQQLNDSISLSQLILKTVIDTFPLAGNFPPTLWKDSSYYNLHIQGDTFYVHGKYYLNGSCKEISCTNSNTDHSSWRTYYENGQPEITGFYGSDPFEFQISKWTYFSASGKADSIIDRDKKYPVNYFDAERSALKRKWSRKDIDIQLQSQKGITYWYVIHWIYNEDGSRKSEEQLEIDVNSGKEKVVHNYVLTSTTGIF